MYELDISDPPQTYLLNSGTSGIDYVWLVDYLATVPMGAVARAGTRTRPDALPADAGPDDDVVVNTSCCNANADPCCTCLDAAIDPPIATRNASARPRAESGPATSRRRTEASRSARSGTEGLETPALTSMDTTDLPAPHLAPYSDAQVRFAVTA